MNDMLEKITTIDEYISTFPNETQVILQKIRQMIHKTAPTATEGISYGIPAFKVDGKYLIYFAGWKHHASFYPIPQGDDAYQKSVEPYEAGRGTLRFPLNQPLPHELIEKTIELLVKERAVRKDY